MSTVQSVQAVVSKKFTLVWNDFLKAFLLAIVSPVIPIVMQSVSADKWVFDWTTIWHTAVAAGVAYLAKNFFSTTATVVKMLVLVLGLSLVATAARSQSLTGTLTNALPDSISKWQGFRLTGPMAMYGYSKTSGNTLLTGLGLAYTWQHLTSGGTWNVDEAVGIAAYAGGSAAPTSLSTVAAIGPYVSFFNGFVSVGGAWNFTTGKPMLTLGVALPLISN